MSRDRRAIDQATEQVRALLSADPGYVLPAIVVKGRMTNKLGGVWQYDAAIVVHQGEASGQVQMTTLKVPRGPVRTKKGATDTRRLKGRVENQTLFLNEYREQLLGSSASGLVHELRFETKGNKVTGQIKRGETPLVRVTGTAKGELPSAD